METIITILNYIDVGAPLLALLFFIRPLKKLSRELLYIFVFVCIQFACNLTASVLDALKTTNYPVYAANIVLSFLVLSAMFYSIFNLIIRKLIIIASILFVGCTVFSIGRGDGISSYNSIVSALAGFIITAYCLIFFYWKLVSDKRMTGLTNSTFFWVVIGLFTYYTGSFFIFISYNYLIVNGEGVVGILWRFHNLLLAVFCFYTIYGLTCKKYS